MTRSEFFRPLKPSTKHVAPSPGASRSGLVDARGVKRLFVDPRAYAAGEQLAIDGDRRRRATAQGAGAPRRRGYR